MNEIINKLPMVTTVAAWAFAGILVRHWRRKPWAIYLAWWGAGMALYGAGTLTESLTALWGWQEGIFRAWYIFGALLGAAPLAQGTAYLLFARRTVHRLSAVLLGFIGLAALFVVLSPIDHSKVEAGRLSGRVLEWQWVRAFSPFINLYALIVLAGGAIYSAWRYGHTAGTRYRCWGNVLIALGALLPGIGGTMTRFGRTEWLYVTELVAVFLIWAGYVMVRRDPGPSIHDAQQEA